MGASAANVVAQVAPAAAFRTPAAAPAPAAAHLLLLSMLLPRSLAPAQSELIAAVVYTI